MAIRGIVTQNTVWDRLVFQKIRDTLGGRVRMVCSGAAPIHFEVMDFLRCALGCLVLEGYGQTESSAVATLTMAGDYTHGRWWHSGVRRLVCSDICLTFNLLDNVQGMSDLRCRVRKSSWSMLPR